MGWLVVCTLSLVVYVRLFAANSACTAHRHAHSLPSSRKNYKQGNE